MPDRSSHDSIVHCMNIAFVMYSSHHRFSPDSVESFFFFFFTSMRCFLTSYLMLFSFKSDGQGQKQSWSTSTPIQHFTMPARSPGDFNRIASQFDNNMRRKLENQRYVQVPYTHYPLNYGPHFGNFQGIQSIQSQNLLQNSVGLQGNPRHFMQSHITPMQPGTAVHFSHQMPAQSSEAYNAFTAYNNPFGMFWRPN